MDRVQLKNIIATSDTAIPTIAPDAETSGVGFTARNVNPAHPITGPRNVTANQKGNIGFPCKDN